MRTNKLFFLLTVLMGLIYLAGCGSKVTSTTSTASIVGMWSETRYHSTYQTNSVITKDTTVTVASGAVMNSYTADGHYYNYLQGSASDSGTYLYSGHILTTYRHGDTSLPAVVYAVSTLTDHTLVEVYTDYPTPNTGVQTSYTFSR